MNWGHKITIVIIVFVIGMLGMVFYASMQSNEMIDDNYYQKELAYQEIINASQNLTNLTTNNIVSQNVNEVIITLPYGAFEKLEGGTIELLRPDSKSKDIYMELIPDGYNRRTVAKSQLIKGLYKSRIKWTNGGVNYYKEESVYVE